MKSFPQLRLRGEHSYRTAYGSATEILDRLEELGSRLGALVDTHGTWGHVDWEKAAQDREVGPAYGSEIVVASDRLQAPKAWMLAESLSAFYSLNSRFTGEPCELVERKGVVVFAGAALTDPDTFDYIDINPRSISRTAAALRLHKATKKPLVLTGDNDYPGPQHRDRFLAWDDSKKMTPQHIASEAELRHALRWIPKRLLNAAVKGAHEVAERVSGLKLASAPIISVAGDLDALAEEGRKYRLQAGHIPAWTQEYQARLEREMEMIKRKRYESYFLVVADLVKWAKGTMLVGPARGSSAGSLVCYLLEITEVDPLVYGLIFERFIDLNRDDLPDIDIDFNDQKRDQVIEYLAAKYGESSVAKIGNINRLKSRSVVAHVGKKLGIPPAETFPILNVLIEYSSGDSRYGNALADTLDTTQPGEKFKAAFPEAKLIGELENHASHTGVHAAGIIVSNEPVVNYCTVRNRIAHVDKKGAEYLNLLKIDVLGLRTLGVIEDAGCVSSELLYGLKFDDPKVLAIFDQHKFSGVFQFEGPAQRRVSMQVPMVDFQKIDHVTALARPGPLGGGAANTYINRNLGNEEVKYRHESMREYLHDTMGVVLYQEQVMRIVRELGRFSWEETSTIRKAMSGRKGKEFFDLRGDMFAQGAAELGIGEEDARGIWEEICSFGAWGMNKSHTVSYAMISYWCAYMKCYHPTDYAAACLRNAKDEEQSVEILREMTAEGVPFVPFDPLLSEVNWAAREGKLVGGFLNVVGIGPVRATRFVEQRLAGELKEKDISKLNAMEVKYRDLRPAHTLWQDYYDRPADFNINGRVSEFKDLEDNENFVVVCRMIRRERRDENETVRIARRGGERKSGQTQFLDMFVVDDSVSKPVVARLRPKLWAEVGESVADKSVDGKDWFLIRGRWLAQFSMVIVEKIKCLTNSEVA